MDFSSYLQKGESVISSTGAYHKLEDSSGRIAVTNSRLLFVKGNNILTSGTVLDVSLDAVDAIEYEAPSPPIGYMVSGVILALGIFLFESANDLRNSLPVPSEILSAIPLFLFVGFVVCVVLSVNYRRAHLKIYTPSKTHEFTARGTELEPFPNAIRKNT